jgi:sugar-specific transcriptional regulator TrmB
MDNKLLTDIGLTGSEIKVYFALLELETSTVGPIIDKSKVPDSKIYSILEKLKDKGLATYVIKNNVKHFQATDPKNLLDILKDKEEAIQEQKKELQEKIIPEIEKRRKLTKEKQEANVYESYDGIKAAFNVLLDTLKKGEEYQVFMLGEELKEQRIITFFQNYHKKRIQEGIKTRLLAHTSHKNIVKRWHKYKGMKIKTTNRKLPLGTFIFKNHIMTVVWQEKPTAFIIKSKKNYEHYKEFFEEVWKKAK